MSIWQGALCRPQKQFCQYENGGIKMKKFISLLLSLTMLLSIVSIVDFSAYADTLTTGKCGDNVTYSFDISTGVLTISGTGEMTDYYYQTDSPFYDNASIKSVVIESGVTSIGICAFRCCTSLTSVTIPDSVTSIGYSAFNSCTSLTSINVEENNINYSSVNGVLFNRNQNELICYPAGKNDKNYEIPDSVTSIGDRAFSNCTSLTSVIIPNSVTSIGNSAFENCTSLTSVTIPDSVTSVSHSAFEGCTSLSNVILHDGVTDIAWMAFSGCKSLTSVTIPNSVTSIDDRAFSNCTSLTSVTIPDSVTSIGNSTFESCISLTSVTIPNSVTSIGNATFEGCINLTMATLPNSVTSIGSSAFANCTSLASRTIPDSVTVIGSNAFYNTPYYNDKSNWINGVLYMSNCLLNTNNYFNLTNNYIVENSTRVIAGNAFCYRANLTSVTIPDSVTSIGSAAFEDCTNLTSVTIPNSVTSIGSFAFYDCTSLTSVTIPDGVTSIGDSAFRYCSGLTSVTIPDSVTIIDERAFSDCTGLKNIIVLSSDCKFGSYIVGEKVKIYGYANSTANEYAVLKGNEFIEIYCNDYGLEHIYSEKVLENPTCKNNGEISYTCDRCSKIYTDTIPALGHNYISKVIKQPTCTEKGTTRYTCSRCGDSYDKDDIAALGHDYVSKVLTQSTCTEMGTTRYTCSHCGDYYDKDDVAALGHNYVSKVLTQPTCTEKGVTRYTCTRCNNYYDKEDIEELGHDTKIVERVEPTLTEDGFYRVECQRDGCGYSSSHPLEQLTLGYNQKVKSNGSDTYKIEMDKSGYLIFDFEGESKKWDINIYDEDYNKIDTLKPVYKEFYKKSYLQISLGSNVPNQNQIAALFAGKYYVEIDRLNDDTNENFSGNYTFSIDYSPANETIKETKNDFYYDAPTAKNIELNKTYNGFLGAKYACYNYVGNPILTTDERDAYKIEIPKGSGLSQFSMTLSSKAFAPLGSNCTLILYNSEFEPYDGFKPLTVSLNSTLNETIYLYEGTYYIAVVNDNSPIEYTFTTTFKPQGTFTCVEHKGKLVNTVNPTCTQNGYNSYVCQICGAKYNEIIPAYGHNAVIDYEVAPTLVSSGLTRGSHCSICGAVITPQTVIPQISAPTQPIVTPNTTVKAVSKPKSAKIKKVKSAKKAVSVQWKKVSGVKGYQVQVATDKKFKKNKKTATVKKQKQRK